MSGGWTSDGNEDATESNRNADVYSTQSSPDDDKGLKTSKSSLKTKRTRSPERDQKAPNDSAKVETPGLRSSGRQRKAPKRYGDEYLAPPPSTKKTATVAIGERRTTSSRKPAQVPEAGATDEEPGQTGESSLASMKPKRRAAAPKNSDSVNNKSPMEDEEWKQSAADGDQDDIDDLVSMQLQQDLTQHDLDGQDSTERIGPLPDYAEVLQKLVQKGLGVEMKTLIKIVLEKLNGKRLIPLRGLDNEYQKVYQLIEQTVTVGEGNSMLLFGSRGSGKSAMVETAISSLAKEHEDDFHVVRLNGFLHTDDRLALREMWRQLGRETETEDEAAKVSSYADTMATLLALLSHPEDVFGSSGNSETITAAKSIVIILDEFDLFVSHPRQTLLYNLFDIAQARKAPIAVLGLTTRVDVTELLEKRVKSRFSHRYVFLPLPKSFEIFSDICFGGLNLEDSEISKVTSDEERAVTNPNAWKTLLEGWRAYLKGLWSDKEFQSHLRRIYNQTKSVKEFLISSILPMTEMFYSTFDATDSGLNKLQVPIPKDFVTQSLSCPDPAPLPFPPSTANSTGSTSLPLSLLLAATRLTALYDPGSANPQNLAPLALSFPAAYTEYVRLLTSAKVSASVSGAAATPGRVWGRDVAREAWEKLVTWGLVVPVGGGSGVSDGRMFRVEVSFEEAVEMAGSGGSLGKWWRN